MPDGFLDGTLDGLLDSLLGDLCDSCCVAVQSNDNFILHDIVSTQVMLLLGESAAMQSVDFCAARDADR